MSHGNYTGTARRDQTSGSQVPAQARRSNSITKEDILGWIERVAADPTDEHHVLVYGTASGTLLATIAALIRIANETGPDAAKLQELASGEQLKDHDRVLSILGATAAVRLGCLTLLNLPEPVVQENIINSCKSLSPGAGD